jgi:hypothetical protein
VSADAIHPEEKTMANGKHTILLAHLTDRATEAPDFQRVLTKYGCSIKTRIGLHEASDSVCSPDGVIILELVGDTAPMDELEKQLQAMQGIEVKRVDFGHA